MTIKTKFNMGDKVFPIRERKPKIFTKCETCLGSRSITTKETSITLKCPACYGGGGSTDYGDPEWSISYESYSDIGKIEVTIRNDNNSEEVINKERYMIQSTGIGSGTVWDSSNLFLTEKEAQSECDKRNNA
jgi:hypothetical protein